MKNNNKSLLYNEKCPLCTSDDCPLYWQGQNPTRDYLHCQYCDLVFVPSRFQLCSEEEKKIYDQHENNPQDEHYRKFLGRLFTPMSTMLSKPSKGLDFGSGPGPTLSKMFAEQGHQCAIYDKFYANDKSTLEKDYGFVSATEVVEHLANPKDVFGMLFSLTEKTKGPVGIMTKLHPQDRKSFLQWHYKNDPTHIAFFSHLTMEMLAKSYDRELLILGTDVVIFTNKKRTS
jgi:hypothetical protein